MINAAQIKERMEVVDSSGAHVGTVADPFLRAMLWGAMWDLVRDARIAPTDYVDAATRELPAEQDEQIAAGVLGRLSRASSAYFSDAQRASIAPRVEIGFDHDSGVARSSLAGTKRNVNALPTMRG